MLQRALFQPTCVSRFTARSFTCLKFLPQLRLRQPVISAASTRVRSFASVSHKKSTTSNENPIPSSRKALVWLSGLLVALINVYALTNDGNTLATSKDDIPPQESEEITSTAVESPEEKEPTPTQDHIVVEPAKETPTASLSLSPLPKPATVIFVLGGPGAGKGTQCANLVRDFGFVHLSAGDLLRAEQATPDSPYGELIKSYIQEGKIVPMEITIALLHQAMLKNIDQTTRFLVDGFPRKMDQALKFEEEVCPSKCVLYFECPEEEMLKRLLIRGETSGRIDDNVESIKKRFRTFIDTSYPVIEYYQEKGQVKTISCLQTVEQVYTETKSIVDDLFKEETN